MSEKKVKSIEILVDDSRFEKFIHEPIIWNLLKTRSAWEKIKEADVVNIF